MHIPAESVDAYFENLPPDRKDVMMRLRQVILENLPEGFEETLDYRMPGYVVPHSVYPDGYHCDTSKPLPFLSIASQKNYVALYHMGIYADESLLEWFKSEYAERVPTRLDMGKSCIRFKKPDQIPWDLIAELVGRMSAERWIHIYETAVRN